MPESPICLSLSPMFEGRPTFLEFFAGGGMARAGLGHHWRCLFANDFDAMKVATYAKNYGDSEIKLRDIAEVTLDDLPAETADLSWASFPCQDLGRRQGPNAIGHVLAFLAAHACACAERTHTPHNGVGERVRLPHVQWRSET